MELDFDFLFNEGRLQKFCVLIEAKHGVRYTPDQIRDACVLASFLTDLFKEQLEKYYKETYGRQT